MIKNIIFDFGGVIIPLNFEHSLSSFIRLGLTDASSMFKDMSIFDTDFFKDFDRGIISEDEFRSFIRNKLSKKNVTDKIIDDAWNAMLEEIPQERIELLHSISTKYNLYLLSNTNNIHIKYFKPKVAIFDKIFIKQYYSSQLGMRKPDAEIFEYVVDEQKLIKEETLFVDDHLPNIQSAKSFGLQTFMYDPKKNKLGDIF